MMVDRDRAEMFAGWFRCLADPTRIQILSLLASERREMTVGEIVAAMDVSQSTVSEHLRRLAETCFVLVEHRGTSSLFRINESCIECFPSAAELVMGTCRDRGDADTTSRRHQPASPARSPPRVTA